MDLALIADNIRRFLAEDIGTGDITTESIFPQHQSGKALFIAKESLLAAGIEHVAPLVFTTQNSAIRCRGIADGTRVSPGAVLLEAEGPVSDLLKAERTALNLAQRLCGIASLTAEFVERIAPLSAKITDTRKTTPGLRVLEKYAVRIGGGSNHRFNLSDGILVKDNHIAACGSITEAVRRVRSSAPHTLKIEVETENLAQVEECIGCGVDIIMLDNMDLALIRKAVRLVHKRALLEVSGGVSLETVRDIAETGVDIISVGSLTHSAKAKDISMRMAAET